MTYHWGTENGVWFTKKALTKAYLLAEGRKVLGTDASNISIEAVLSRGQGLVKRVILYSNRRLGPTGELHRRELLAVVSFVSSIQA